MKKPRIRAIAHKTISSRILGIFENNEEYRFIAIDEAVFFYTFSIL
jgi:hypothetical protein